MEIMNISAFLEEMDNDYDDVNMIVTEFSESIKIQLQNMLEQLGRGDFTTLSREAHSIKGGARNVMAPRLESAAENLEFAAKDFNQNNIKKSLNNLSEEFLVFNKFITENLYINH
ncbi:Hpt domain-containing protein [Thiospirochaeta perfilievii]|uniref:Hpt domain-containing protein n=2 Tax=Thiospirochaeta perfilievii TaxID=252967 RepID=A0A5C1QDH5_9SPIO|nr:Hpt domain-containing protein [Thiospirochaeta perfilievii]